MIDAKAIGRRIKQERMAQGLTQEALAERAGISVGHVSVIERGIQPPRLETFISIINVLQVSADALLVDVIDQQAQLSPNKLIETISRLTPTEQQKLQKIIDVVFNA